jgi:hypothetical protein
VVFSQARDHGPESHDSGCGQHASLPHAPSKHLPGSVGLPDKFAVAT